MPLCCASFILAQQSREGSAAASLCVLLSHVYYSFLLALQVQDSNRSTATQASSQQLSSLENALSLESTPSIIQDRQ